jgi:hypothetical protein
MSDGTGFGEVETAALESAAAAGGSPASFSTNGIVDVGELVLWLDVFDARLSSLEDRLEQCWKALEGRQ